MKHSIGFLGRGLAIAAVFVAIPAYADVKDGVEAWQRGAYAEAIGHWRSLAIAGDPDAQFNMGQAYKLGRGAPLDLNLAQSWYEKAARQGHIQAEDNYGLVLFQNGNRKQALPWLEKSVARDEPRAQYILGTALFNGDIMEKDWVRAYALMTRSSSTGLTQASQALSQMDVHIPLDQRQRGTALARQAELKAMKPQQAPRAAPAKVSAPAPKIATVAPKPTTVQPTNVVPAAAAQRRGDWRIQLGAFREKARADAQWAMLKRKVAGLSALQPVTAKSGALTRLQTGPFASKAEAEKQCRAVKAAGQPCLTFKS